MVSRSLRAQAIESESLQLDGVDLQLAEQMTQMALQEAAAAKEPEVTGASQRSSVFDPASTSTKVGVQPSRKLTTMRNRISKPYAGRNHEA